MAEEKFKSAPQLGKQGFAKVSAGASSAAGILDHLTDEFLESPNFMESVLSGTFPELQEGTMVKGLIIGITDKEILVDVGYKSEGVINIQEFTRMGSGALPKIGDVLDVVVERTEDKDGLIQLSKEKADKHKVWDKITDAFEKGKRVKGRVLEKIKGGLSVDIGVKAFLPGSQVGLRNMQNLESLIGEEIDCQILKLNQQRRNIVLSRKAVLEEENAKKREELVKNLHEGNILHGAIKNITEYGAFIDLGGIDGLLHITDMSWGRINHPSEVFQVGDPIDVVILKYDSEKDRVSLGYKQKTPDPWLSVETKYPSGSKARGKVISVTDYGAFVELEEGIEGLIHVSEMSWSKRLRHPSKMVQVGDILEAQVLDVDIKNKRISLGMKQIGPNPWENIDGRFPLGAKVKGVVRNITNFGAFVEIEDGIDGLIHISDMSWTQRIKHPSEIVKKGDEVEAVILDIDAANERISLGMKQATTNPWDNIHERFPLNSDVTAKVVRLTDFGAFAELEGGIEGVIHIREMERLKEEYPDAPIQEGDVRQMRIVGIDPAERKIAVSIRAFEGKKDIDGLEDFQFADDGTDRASLADTLGEEAMTKLKALHEPAPAKKAKKSKKSIEAVPVTEAPAEEAVAEAPAEETAVEEAPETKVEPVEGTPEPEAPAEVKPEE